LALKDGPNPHIALLPLDPELRVKFSSTTTWESAWSMSGTPYDYHHIIFSWINTVAGNIIHSRLFDQQISKYAVHSRLFDQQISTYAVHSRYAIMLILAILNFIL
jgi:hypothetical protein